MSNVEKKQNLIHAIDALQSIKQKINQDEARVLEDSILQSEKEMNHLRKKMDSLRGIISLFLDTEYYHKLSIEWYKLVTKLDDLYEHHYDRCNWFGPYRETNTEGYMCPGWCSSDPNEFVIWRRHLSESEKPVRPLGKSSPMEWAKYAWEVESLCIECIISHNLYCVVCGEVIYYSETRKHKDGYCICSNCEREKQGQYSLAGEYIAKCYSCGKKHVPLKLIGDKLFCSHCS